VLVACVDSGAISIQRHASNVPASPHRHWRGSECSVLVHYLDVLVVVLGLLHAEGLPKLPNRRMKCYLHDHARRDVRDLIQEMPAKCFLAQASVLYTGARFGLCYLPVCLGPMQRGLAKYELHNLIKSFH